MKQIFVTQSSMPSWEEYADKIKPLWDTRLLTNMGKLHNEFERALKDYLHVPHVSLMVNGHMALELAITAMHFPEGSEVITTPFTFVSTTHAIVRNGLQPVFCDIKKSDYTIDEEKIEDLITDKTVAIIPVHVYGNVCNIERIQEIADKHHLKVIYDAAHAFGVTYKGKGVGRFGDASVYSFHATKVFHSIEGGAVTFHDPALEDVLYNLKNFGIRSEEVVSEIGANAKMNELCAAMGLCNLAHIDAEIAKRKKVVERYQELFKGINGIKCIDHSKDVASNYAYFPILIDETVFKKSRNQIYNELRDYEIYSRKYFYPLTSDQECFKGRYSGVSIPIARYVAERILVLPLYAGLEMEDVDRIVDIICK